MALLSVKSAIGIYAHDVSAPSPIAQAKRQAAVDHILASARRLVLQHGLDATMEQLAEASGVSRRTLFRHFETRERLLAAAFEAGITGYRSQLPAYGDFDGDVHRWLRATCESAHRMNSTIGPGFFELSSRTDLPADLAAAEARRRREFRGAMTDITRNLWRAAGGDGDAPETLETTVTAHLSPHFTAALSVDAARGWQVAADLAYQAIVATLDQRPAGG